MILSKYTNKRKLGKGAYGDVVLVQNSNGEQLAIKMVSKKMIQNDPYLKEYLEEEKNVMLNVKSRHVMKLIGFEEDENFKYFICQYCNGGDLLNYQARQPNKVFDIKSATKILSQVIQGLEVVHRAGYLHRDIKPQNILLKKDGQNNEIFKIADFGFAKKAEKGCNTVLGTENYMSPEIFLNIQDNYYSYEVDMWAFGVLFYFMLNMEYPFRINPHMEIQQKRQELIKQSTNFNYSQVIAKNSKKKIMENCNQNVNDLFRRIFHPDGKKRITFLQIREHPLFREHFPDIKQDSVFLYSTAKKKDRLSQYVKGKSKAKENINPNKNTTFMDDENVPPQVYISGKKTFDERARLETEIDKYQFLLTTAKDLPFYFSFINDTELLAFKYNLLKFYLIQMRNFKDSLKPQLLQAKYPQLKWKQFTKDKQFSQLKKKVETKINEAELSISQVYDQCTKLIDQIKKINQSFEENLEYEVKTKDFSGVFKTSYRQSTGRIYEIVRQKIGTGNRFLYLTAIIVICHSFNQLLLCSQDQLRNLFQVFVQEKKKQGKLIQFSELRSWMSQSSKDKIKVIIKNVISGFFG